MFVLGPDVVFALLQVLGILRFWFTAHIVFIIDVFFFFLILQALERLVLWTSLAVTSTNRTKNMTKSFGFVSVRASGGACFVNHGIPFSVTFERFGPRIYQLGCLYEYYRGLNKYLHYLGGSLL